MQKQWSLASNDSKVFQAGFIQFVSNLKTDKYCYKFDIADTEDN